MHDRADIKASDVTPRWPPPLPKGSFPHPTWQLTVVDTTSIAFVTNSYIKVRTLHFFTHLQLDTEKMLTNCVLLQTDHTGIVDKRSKEVIDKAVQGLAVLHEELSTLPELPEVDWSRMRQIEFQDLLRQRAVHVDRLAKFGCQLCEDFADHVRIYPDKWHWQMCTDAIVDGRSTPR